MILTKRVYDPVGQADGTRLLVERLWPRGIKKTSLKIESWLKDVAPSTELRKWFSHDPAKWDEFRHRYFGELEANPDAWRPIVEALRHGNVTLIYSSRDTERNNAIALEEFLRLISSEAKALDVCGRRTVQEGAVLDFPTKNPEIGTVSPNRIDTNENRHCYSSCALRGYGHT